MEQEPREITSMKQWSQIGLLYAASLSFSQLRNENENA